jgi:hypothetical protein
MYGEHSGPLRKEITTRFSNRQTLTRTSVKGGIVQTHLLFTAVASTDDSVKSSLTELMWPCCTAKCRATKIHAKVKQWKNKLFSFVHPALPLLFLLSTSLTLTPFCINIVRMFALSLSAASCNGVLFRLSTELTFAPARTYIHWHNYFNLHFLLQ